MARYLITGGSGFVGSNLIRKLIKENQELTILIRDNSDLWRINDLLPKIQTIKTDFSNYEKLEKLISDVDPNFVYHLGTYGGYPFQTSIEKIAQVNIINTIKLFKSLSKCNSLELVINFGTAGSKNIPPGTLVDCTKFVERDMDVTEVGFKFGQTPWDDPATDQILEFEDVFNPIGKHYTCGSGDNIGIDRFFKIIYSLFNF